MLVLEGTDLGYLVIIFGAFLIGWFAAWSMIRAVRVSEVGYVSRKVIELMGIIGVLLKSLLFSTTLHEAYNSK